MPDITNSKKLQPAYTQLLADKPKAKTISRFQSWLTIFGYNEYFTAHQMIYQTHSILPAGSTSIQSTLSKFSIFFNLDVENRVIDTQHTKTYYRKYSTSKQYRTFKFHIKPALL